MSQVHPAPSVLDAIGHTPLVELRHVVPAGCARLLVKLEGANPTGSMKDRMARSAIEAAARDGRLAPGGTVVEYTAGHREEVDDIQTVTTADAKAMARRLAQEEAIFAGTSSGANVVAALRVCARLGPGATVVTIMCDSGLRYLSTDVFR